MVLDENYENFGVKNYRVAVEVEELSWRNFTHEKQFRLCSEEPDFTEYFREFLGIMFGFNWENRVLKWNVTVIEYF